jgi:hypothetical protein
MSPARFRQESVDDAHDALTILLATVLLSAIAFYVFA